MKIASLSGGVLPLLLLVACGGDKPSSNSTPNASSPNATANATVDAAAKKASAAKTPEAREPVVEVEVSEVQTPAAAAPTPQEPKPEKRIRRPRVNFKLFQTLLGNDGPAPKAPVAATADLVALGKTLYHSELLSQKGNLSCASCHNLGTYGVDNKPVSPGSTGENGTRNTPTVYNASRQFRQFWDGRAESVEEQAIMPVLNPIEHGLADEADVVAKINKSEELVAGFKKAFPGQDAPVTATNFGVAIGAFERTLVTRSQWDDYIEGNQKALSNLELLGLQKFTEHTCNSCHMTKTLGGSMYQKLGVYKPYTGKDTGRMQVTNSVADKYLFKVPSLLNVEMTAPYYHDGSVATLEEAVKKMASEQLNKTISDDDVEAIVAFLKALTGKLPEEFAKK